MKRDSPEYLQDLFSQRTRRNHVKLPKLNLEVTSRSFSIIGSKMWNALPQRLRDMKNIGSFKKALRGWISENVQRFVD